MKWRILDGPHARPDFRFTDGDIWHATIENTNDPVQRQHINVVISRTALSSDRDGLPRDVREAIESDGRSAIERFLDESTPPARILVSSTSIAESVAE